MATIKQTLVLTGPYAGKTMVLGTGKLSSLQFQFTKGRCTMQGSEKDVEGVTRYLGRCYKAFPEGSMELAKAQGRGEPNGKSDLHANSESGETKEVPSQLQPNRKGITQIPASDGEDDAPTNQRETRGVPSGNRQSDSGVSQEKVGDESKSLLKAIKGLDPLNDEHWNQAGLPRVDVLAANVGPIATRKNIEALAPGYNREQAFEAQSQGPTVSPKSE